MPISRRGFLKNIAALSSANHFWPILGGLAAGSVSNRAIAPGLFGMPKLSTSPIAVIDPQSPINSRDFNGDRIDKPHDILWNIDGYIAGHAGGVPLASVAYDLVIVGGGISGLLTAWLYLKKNPSRQVLMLEQDHRVGGNSKGEQRGDARYSIGAAYIVAPDAGSEIETLLRDLSLTAMARKDGDGDLTVLQNGKLKSFWEGETDPRAVRDFKRVRNRLAEMREHSDLEFEGKLSHELDAISFDKWLKREFGELHPHLLEFFQLYGWSSFCGSIDELSAFQFLNFICFEMGAVLAFPGGNAAIAEALWKKLNAEPGFTLKTNAMALKVTATPDRAAVVYEHDGKLTQVEANAAVMACAKFIARRLLPELEPEQASAMASLRYRSYLVGNAILNRKIKSPTYDLFLLQNEVPSSPTAMQSGARSFSDLCFGSWAQNDLPEQSVLTLYQGLAFDGARQFLFHPNSHSKYREHMLHALEQQVLPPLGLTQSDIAGLRLTRWGHPLPLARVGLLSKELRKRRPIH
ncbi:MAG: FAD-dependent oxidoreductase [Bdellovibrionales bacterium]|nr:FAD-dependent oxidoreductase [Bdellovibrionales bacterium]